MHGGTFEHKQRLVNLDYNAGLYKQGGTLENVDSDIMAELVVKLFQLMGDSSTTWTLAVVEKGRQQAVATRRFTSVFRCSV